MSQCSTQLTLTTPAALMLNCCEHSWRSAFCLNIQCYFSMLIISAGGPNVNQDCWPTDSVDSRSNHLRRQLSSLMFSATHRLTANANNKPKKLVFELYKSMFWWKCEIKIKCEKMGTVCISVNLYFDVKLLVFLKLIQIHFCFFFLDFHHNILL